MTRLAALVVAVVALVVAGIAGTSAGAAQNPVGYELRLVKDIAPGISGSEISVGRGVWAGGGMLFRAKDKHSSELWRTDGSTAGTRFLEDTNPRGEGRPQNFTRIGKKVVFSAWGPRDRSGSLWLSDGTPYGTRHLMSISEGEGDVSQFVAAGELVFFVHEERAERALWRTDGTVEGTFAVTTHLDRRYRPLGAVGDRLVYVESEDGRPRVMSTDGTRQGEAELVQTDSWRSESAGDQLIFSGTDPSSSQEATFITDGTPRGTSVLRDPTGYSPYLCYSYCESTTAGKRMFFSETRPSGPDRIWSVDALGRLRILWAQGEGEDGVGSLENTRAGLYFAVFESDAGGTLWHSDRTRAGTAPLDPELFDPAGRQRQFTDLIRLGSGVAIEVQNADPESSDEFWTSDGTEAGTTRVSAPEQRFSTRGSLIASRGDIAFLRLSDDAHGSELWRIAPADRQGR